MPHVDELVHDRHDPILVVSLASGDLAATDRDYEAAQSLITSCSDCARLHDDIVAIAGATKALPRAERTRDFRLTDADAARLRPAGWRRLLGGFANGPLFSRQLGAGLATLGIAGLLLTALPGIPLGGMGSAGAASQPASAAEAPAYESLESGNNPAAQLPAPSTAAASSQPYAVGVAGGGSPARTNYDTMSGPSQPAALTDGTRNVGTGASRAPGLQVSPNAGQQQVSSNETEQSSSGGPSTMAIVSTVLLVAGLVLLLARRFTRGAPSA